jgi:hypothetical protein
MMKRTAISIAAGLGIAVVYTLTPLTVIVVAAGAVLVPLLLKGVPGDERRWVGAIVAAALLARLLAIGGILLLNLPNHDDQFVGASAGDEAYAMSRAARTRDIILGEPTSKYDFFVAFDEYGRNSYVTALTAAQVVLGPTPYSVRVLNSLLFVVAALLLYQLGRAAFGPLPAALGLAVVLFWPTLFVWSISLLKESLYLLLGVVALRSAIALARRPGWRSAMVNLAAAAGVMWLLKDLRPAALMLTASGLALGLAGYVMTSSRRSIAIAAVALLAVLAVALGTGAVEGRLIAGLEAAAKTHSGHVFTVGHEYKLLDPGFYVNPRTPASSTLTLTRDEAARFVGRAVASFFAVPMPWQLRSSRELAYLPEQMAWYALVLMLPIGIAAGFRRDRLMTCMLVGYVVPTAAALALTNGNVGTLLRLRGLVIPYLAWVGVAGFCAALGVTEKRKMRLIDENGRLWGRVNLFDAAVAAFVILAIPIAYGTFLLFRAPAPRIESVARVPITMEERRVAGGSRLTAKLKVRGSGLRPMLRASIGGTQSLGFVFEDPNSADVLVGEVPPGTHDLVLYDGVQEVARLPKSVTIEPSAAARIAAVGTLIHLDRATADALKPGPLAPGGPPDAVVKVGVPRAEAAGSWQRDAEIVLQCDPDPNQEGCTVGGVMVAARPLPSVKVVGPSGSQLTFVLTDVFPALAPTPMTADVRFASAAEVLNLIHSGDRDALLDDRAATVVAINRRRDGASASEADVTLSLGVDQSPEGWRYRGLVLKAGAPFTLATARYQLEGTVLKAGDAAAGGTK